MIAFVLSLALFGQPSVKPWPIGVGPGYQPAAGKVTGAPVGFAFWFYNVSTFEGRCGIWLEDLYVRPAARGAGAGKALLAALARRCAAEGLARIEWAVLDWNAPAIAFYDSLGASAKTEWITRRLAGAALEALAASR